MSISGRSAVVFISAVFLWGCQSAGEVNSNQRAGANTGPAKTTASPAQPSEDGVIPSGTGVEKEKPASGTGNVQGKVLYNGQPAEGIEVKLCETFSQYMSGCGGKTFTAKTDSSGEYLIKNVPPGTYEGLISKVYNTNYYVFATSGFVSSAKYKIDADTTFFAPDTNLFKNDLKLSNPKAGSKVAAGNIEVKWEAYPDAAYYKLSIHGDSSTGGKTELDYVNKRIDGVSFTLDKPLSAGSYTVRIDAYNGNDVKLAQSSSDIKFTVTG